MSAGNPLPPLAKGNGALPVTLIIPTRNCRDELERHLPGIEMTLPLFSQIVSVDSQSTDGTYELLKEHFSNDPRVTLLSLPPGLYPSWNKAVAHSSQEWIYFSTVGDILDAEKFPDFYDTAQTLRCDVLISPPVMLKADGRTPADVRWPVHRLLENCCPRAARLLSQEETVLGLFSFITGSILGSSASNLYRTEFLQGHPFPEEFGHAGDTAWGLRYGPEIRMGIFPEPVAGFTMDWEFRERDARQQRDAFLKLSEEGRKSLRRAVERGEELEFLAGWFDAMTASKDTLWNWLADQAELAANHHRLVEDMKKMEAELARRWPERVANALRRRLWRGNSG